MRALLVSLLAASTAFAGHVYIGAWQKQIIVFDEDTEKIVDRIQLANDVPNGLMLSNDRKKLFVMNAKDAAIEVVDLQTRKVENQFVLNEGNTRIRFFGMAADPEGKLLYGSSITVTKEIDRFSIGKNRFHVIDLAQKKIVKTHDMPAEDQNAFRRGAGFRVSPDGKYLYVFRDVIKIYDTTDFKEVDKIDLSKPDNPDMERVSFGGGDDPHADPATIISVFNSSDPIVHRNIFGIARFDLNNRRFEFTPVGPTTGGMMGLRLSPDRKRGYTVGMSGSGGNLRYEFIVFDMATKQIVKRQDFPGRTRLSFGISGNGKNLYIYGAGETLELYDSATLMHRKTIDLEADTTTGMVVVP